mgnify:CR=1 FL=1
MQALIPTGFIMLVPGKLTCTPVFSFFKAILAHHAIGSFLERLIKSIQRFCSEIEIDSLFIAGFHVLFNIAEKSIPDWIAGYALCIV